MNSWLQRLWKICNEAQMATCNELDDATGQKRGHMGTRALGERACADLTHAAAPPSDRRNLERARITHESLPCLTRGRLSLLRTPSDSASVAQSPGEGKRLGGAVPPLPWARSSRAPQASTGSSRLSILPSSCSAACGIRSGLCSRLPVVSSLRPVLLLGRSSEFFVLDIVLFGSFS